jgi:hypothetical protein
LRINKTEVIEDIKIKCTFDIRHGASSTMYYVESLLDGSILHIGHGNANEEMSDKEMSEYVLRVGLDLMKMSRYKDHMEEVKTKLERAIGIIENVSSSDSVFREACFFLDELKKG